MVRALRLHRRCHRFESGRAHVLKVTMTRHERRIRYEAYVKRADPVMLGLAFVFLVAWSTRVVWTGAPAALRDFIVVVQLWLWAAFLADVIVRLRFAEHRWHWLRTHPVDVIAVLLPATRPLKILAVFTQGPLLGGGKRALKTSQAVAVSALLMMWIGAVSVLSFERPHMDANIENFPDALWWSLVTVTTVGYGDFFPVTLEGRVVAAALMLVGISLIGVVTASVAAWFVSLTAGEEEAHEEDRHEELEAHIRKLEAKLDLLVADAEDRRRASGG